MVSKNDIINALRDVYDPEIPINVYDLGLIYEITIKESGFVHILMTLTSPTCPTADYIKEMIHDAVAGVEGVLSVDVELTFDPLWTPDRVSQEAKEELGLVDDNSGSTEVENLFIENDSLDKKEYLCFNCSISDNEVPLIDCVYKSERLKICPKCFKKY